MPIVRAAVVREAVVVGVVDGVVVVLLVGVIADVVVFAVSVVKIVVVAVVIVVTIVVVAVVRGRAVDPVMKIAPSDMTSGMKTATSMELFCVCARKNGVSFSAKTNELGGMLVQRSGEIISQFLFNSGLKAIRDHFSIRAGSMKRFDQLQSLEYLYMTVLYIEFILLLFVHFSHFHFSFLNFSP